jgi:iron complex outermembrane receptor protein
MIHDGYLKTACTAIVGAALTLRPGPVCAQTDADSLQLADVVVVAQKRPERLQDVPITINAFDGSQLNKSGIGVVNDLATVVPGLVYADVTGYGLPYLRGIGTTATGPGYENPVATYVDGVYYATQGADAFAFNNIASVEVDKGPQGTLFGRNATGGAIQINTLNPSREFAGNAEVGYGSYDTTTLRGYVTGGLTANLAANLAFNYSDQGKGYGLNLANRALVDKTDNLGLRSKLLFTVDAATALTVIFDYNRLVFIPALAPFPGTTPQFDPPVAANPRDVYGNPQPDGRNTQYGVSATLVHDLNLAKFTSITAVRTSFVDSLFDSTLTAVPGTLFFIEQHEPHRQASQEFQLASPGGTSFDWVSGAYVFWERSGYNDPILIGGSSFAVPEQGIPSGIIQNLDYKTYSAALYGQGTSHFTQATALTVGLRYTSEYRNDVFAQTLPDFDSTTVSAADRAFNNLSWRLALEHYFSSDTQGYVSHNRGFKSGGYSNGSPFLPERLDDYEMGAKQEWLEHRLRINAAAFFYDYRNIQTVTYPQGQEDITNGADAHLYGLDLDADAVISGDLKLSAGLEWLHSRYVSFPNAPISVPNRVIAPGSPSYGDGYESGGTTYTTRAGGAAGNELPKAPKFTGDLSADYTTPLSAGKFSANLTYAYDSGWYAEADNRLKQPAYGVLNAFMSFGSANDDLVFKVWGRNLTDKLYAAFIASQSNGDFAEWAPPRTYGVTLSRKF